MKIGTIEETGEIFLNNVDVVEALLEVTGAWAACHSFEDYSPGTLSAKYAEIIKSHIESYEPVMKSGTLPVNIVPHRKVN